MVQNGDPVRTKMFTMRLSEEESTRLTFLAEYHGASPSTYLRMLMKREEAEVLKTAPPFVVSKEHELILDCLAFGGPATTDRVFEATKAMSKDPEKWTRGRFTATFDELCSVNFVVKDGTTKVSKFALTELGIRNLQRLRARR